ncbi:Blp family class II bacteriocin [Fructobacillus durionis]|uniref:Bacteriocin-type signal sequence-containing protein n=1 Tax=Fructobacillus durionis TaxID=283737 RepID=A0A1I1FJW3_9LACO|nr:Blp family class II bacteriocin [Fructobacillus durionis]SFB99789.1 bacteriocin-type signal sequence-containing protein [Fructobacillus durionis]
MNLEIKVLNNNQLSKITGGKKINWGSVGGSCIKGALFGAAFGGNAIGGCAGSAAADASLQFFF